MENHFYAVIMAGGGGTRLWPLSRKETPKQLLNLTEERSLFRIAIDRLSGLFDPGHIFIVSVEDQIEKLSQHAGQLKKRIRELSQKQYWAQFEQAPDFIVLFIPGDQFLAAALERQPELLEYALAKKIVLATPTSLVALLRVIAHGWQQSALDEQTKVVRELASEFDKRLEVFSRHLAGVGRDLSRTVETYNRTIGSYEHKIRPISQKLLNTPIR